MCVAKCEMILVTNVQDQRWMKNTWWGWLFSLLREWKCVFFPSFCTRAWNRTQFTHTHTYTYTRRDTSIRAEHWNLPDEAKFTWFFTLSYIKLLSLLSPSLSSSSIFFSSFHPPCPFDSGFRFFHFHSYSETCCCSYNSVREIHYLMLTFKWTSLPYSKFDLKINSVTTSASIVFFTLSAGCWIYLNLALCECKCVSMSFPLPWLFSLYDKVSILNWIVI